MTRSATPAAPAAASAASATTVDFGAPERFGAHVFGCSIGVSTSRKPCSTMKLRIEATVLLRATKRARAASSVIRST